MIIIASGFLFISLYLRLVPAAADLLKNKGLQILTFPIFMSVSSLANCGFTPTDESMLIFKKNSALLLLTIPQVLVGKTLYWSSNDLVKEKYLTTFSKVLEASNMTISARKNALLICL